MDIDKFLPNQSSNWCVKHDTIYYLKGGYIPVLKKIDGILFISLDQRITKQIIKMIEKLTNLNESFLLCDRLTIDEKHIYKQDLSRIIDNYLYSLSDETFFRFIKNSDFDYLGNLAKFLDTFRVHKLFKYRYEYLKKNHYHKKWIDWYTRRNYWTVKNGEIRDYYSVLERQVKLNIFFS